MPKRHAFFCAFQKKLKHSAQAVDIPNRGFMRIEDSNLQMNSSRRHAEAHSRKDELKVWTGPRPGSRPEEIETARPRPVADVSSISEEARARFESIKKRFSEVRSRELEVPSGVGHDDFLKKLILEAFIGKKIEVCEIVKAKDEPADSCVEDNGASQPSPEWGMEYKSTVFSASIEETVFSASGTVRTSDGQEVGFTLELAMRRASVSETTASLRAGNAVDPLVINFGGTAAELTSTRFAFDLDSDGEDESIPFAGPGSGFLVFDRNRDGKANDGTELFGPSTGNGFAELAKLDGDKNSWIDEADAAWSSLYVWTKAADGSDSIKSMKAAGIGAICTTSSQTPFEVRSREDSLEGIVRSTGIFLKEDLAPGTVQQIDLVV